VVVPESADATAPAKTIAAPSHAAAAKAAIQFLNVSMTQSSCGAAGCVIAEEPHSASGNRRVSYPRGKAPALYRDIRRSASWASAAANPA